MDCTVVTVRMSVCAETMLPVIILVVHAPVLLAGPELSVIKVGYHFVRLKTSLKLKSCNR